MKILKAINLKYKEKHVISFVGGGGKSTAMNKMAMEFKAMGKKVLVTTTTMLFLHEHQANDEFVIGDLPDFYEPVEGTITLLGSSTVDNELGTKIVGLNVGEIEEIHSRNIFDIILLEADGARLKPIKAPASHEPMVPDFSTITIGLIGLDSIGRPLRGENVHRPEILAPLLEVELGHVIREVDIVRLVLHDEGLFKGCHGRKILFLNKASNEKLFHQGVAIREDLSKEGFKDVFITDIIRNRID